jgi:hypothetical protein
MMAQVVTAPQQLNFQQEFVLFLYKAGVPLHLTRHPALLSYHVTSCSAERNWSAWEHLCKKARNRLPLTRAEMLVTGQCSEREAKSVEAGEEVVLRVLAEAQANELVPNWESH